MDDQLEKIFKLQNQLNRSVDEDWLEIRTIRDWQRALWLEAAELLESMPWKWWKHSEIDEVNLKLEIIDILHMLLSLILILDHKEDTDLRAHFNEVAKNSLNVHDDSNPTTDEAMVNIEALVVNTLSGNFKLAIDEFFLIANEFMTIDELFTLYEGKNVLNKIRQDFGYREGKYKKIINGKEDNYYLVEYVEQGLDIKEVDQKLRNLTESVKS